MSLGRASPSIVPTQWKIFQVNQPATHHIFQILLRCKDLRASLIKINDYSSQRLEKYEYIDHILTNNLDSVEIQSKERLIDNITNEAVEYLRKFWDQQRQVLESFLDIIYKEFSNNMSQMRMLKVRQDKIYEQYLLYVKEQFIIASETFERFVEKELKLGLQYRQILQQQPGASQNHWSIISKILGDNLKTFFRDVKKEREKLEQSQSSIIIPCIVLFAVFLIGLVMLSFFLASFEIYGNNRNIQQLAYLWQGSGVFLLYLWIDYGMSEYCLARRVNLLFGMGCGSYHSIVFYKHSWKPVILLSLTNFYVFLFILFLKWQQNLYLGATINILLIAYQFYQFLFGHCRIGMIQTFFSKLSCLHFNLILIPLSDIIASIFILFHFPVHDNFVFIGTIYLIATVPIFYIRICKLAKKEQNSLYEKSIFFIILLVLQIVALVYRDMLAFKVVDFFIKEATIIFLVSFQFSIFSNTFLPKEFVKTCKNLFCCLQQDRSQKFYKRIQQENSYPRIIKLFLLFSSICLPVLLPFAMYVQSFTGVHKYAYQAFIMFQYILWKMLQINEINLRLKHPLSCFIHFSQSIAFVTSQHFNQDILFELMRNNPIDADLIFNRDQRVTAAKEYLTPKKIQEFNKDLSRIQDNFRQNTLWQMVEH